MIPDAIINGYDNEAWISSVQACRIIDIHQPQWYSIIDKYPISKQRIAGRWVYYRPDVEAAATKVAAMRAEREAKRAAV